MPNTDKPSDAPALERHVRNTLVSACIAAGIMLLAGFAAAHFNAPWSEDVAYGIASILILVAGFSALFNWGLRAARHSDESDRG